MSIIGSTTAPHVAKQEYFRNAVPTPGTVKETVAKQPIPLVTEVETFTMTDSFSSRETADGRKIVSNSYAKIKTVVGSTVKCNNLITFPYYSTFTERFGVQITVQDDGGIYLKGTATGGDAYFNLCKKNFGEAGLAMKYEETANTNGVVCFSKYGSASKNVGMGYDNRNLMTFIVVYDGSSVDGVVYPMANEGETAEPYQKYFEGLKNASFAGIESTGRNLIPFPYFGKGAGSATTINGVTFIVNADGSITAKGTATVETYFQLCRVDFGVNSWYSMSGGTTNGFYFKDCNYNASNKYSYIVIPKDTTVDKTYYPMINNGTTSLPYTRYVEPSVFNFPKTELGEWDKIDFEKQKIVRGSYTITLDGSESWSMSSVNVAVLTLADLGAPKAGYYKEVVATNGFTDKFVFTGGNETTGFGAIRWRQKDEDIEVVKSFLQQNPMTICYEVHIHTETPFTDEEKASGDEYRADSGGNENVLGNDNAEYGAENTLTIEYVEDYIGEIIVKQTDYKSYNKECSTKTLQNGIKACKVYGEE